jgi:hydrogenase-4 membrane subunit HyfE
MNILAGTQMLVTLESLLFLSVVFMHLTKRNVALVAVYAIQSLAVIAILAVIGISEREPGLVLAAVLACIVKVVLAPIIFMRAIKSHDERALTGTYLNTPLTLIVMLTLLLLAQTDVFAVLAQRSAGAEQAVSLALASIFISMFLAINQKGIMYQIVGVLSMENAIVALGSLFGVEHTFALEFGILFDIGMWMVGAAVFISLIHHHFGTLDTSVIKDLRD